MASLPLTRRNSRTSSSLTRLSARALTRWTVAMNSSTSASVISRSRLTSSAASSVSPSGAGWARRCEGASTAARARHAATTLGATSANRPAGRPTDRTATSLSISLSIESKLTFPGSALMNPNGKASRSASSPRSSPVPSAVTSASVLAVASAGTREAIRAHSASSAWRSAEATIRSARPVVGGSMRSTRQRAANSWASSSGRRSASATFSASHPVSLSASSTVHSRNPSTARIWAR